MTNNTAVEGKQPVWETKGNVTLNTTEIPFLQRLKMSWYTVAGRKFTITDVDVRVF